MKKIIFVFICIFSSVNIFAFDIAQKEECILHYESSPFKLNLALDLSLLGTGSALTGGTFLAKKFITNQTYDGTFFDINSVNAFDRWAMKPYSESIHKAGTAVCLFTAASPFVIIAGQTVCGNFPLEELLTFGTMYVESFLFSHGIKESLKICVRRVRPYMYFDSEKPEDKLSDGDWQYSFPSGHTTFAFMGASFAISTFAYYFPKSSWRIPVACLSFGLAGTTAALRMMSGNHYFSDVLAGAAIGSLCGWFVPFLHNKIGQSKKVKEFTENGNQLSFLPNGVYVKFAL